MRIALYSTKPYDKEYFQWVNESFNHEIKFFEANLNADTAYLSSGFDAICPFVNDTLDAQVIDILAANGVKLIALRSAGFNHVDLEHASKKGLRIMRVPDYSPYAVAEHTLALILTLNRKTHKAYNRVREGNFSLDRLVGFDLHRKTVGVIGTGKIGRTFARIIKGFGTRVIAYDKFPSDQAREIGVEYVEFDELLEQSDIISLHCPLTPETYQIINKDALDKMKTGAMLINTSRGKLINSEDVLEALKSKKLGYLGIDVYAQEENLFFEDLSEILIQDETISLLLTYPNVLITSHQAFLTKEALQKIAEKTLQNLTDFAEGNESPNEVKPEKVKAG